MTSSGEDNARIEGGGAGETDLSVDEVLSSYYVRSHSPECNSPAYSRFRIYKRELLWSYTQLTLGLRSSRGPFTILDVGCWDASDLESIVIRQTAHWREPAAVEAWRVVGIDSDPRGIAFAKRRFAQLQMTLGLGRADFSVCDITHTLPFGGASFDLVICSEVVEHLEAPDAVVGEIFRVLRNGGCLAFTTDNEPSILAKAKRAVQRAFGRYQESDAERWSRTHAAEHETREIDGRAVPFFGHINTKSCTEWERVLRRNGFRLVVEGPYRTATRKDPGAGAAGELMAAVGGFIVSVAPSVIAKHLADTTAVLAQKHGDQATT